MGIRSEWMEVQMTELESALQNLWSDGLYKIILSNPIKKEPEVAAYRKVVLNRKNNGWQAEQYTEKQVFHENLKADQVGPFVEQALEQAFRQCSGWDGEWEHTIRISKKGKVTGSKKRVAATQAPKAQTENNRKKHYLLEEGTIIPPLVDMGIFTAEGKIVRTMYDKYRQINRFVELIDDEIDALPKDQTIRIIDFGCGKSYLTFILYYYLVELKKRDVEITGLDLKADVIAHCNKAAEKYGYDKLHFQVGDIGGYETAEQIDMVISLHACDTATDYALYHAIRWKAKLIFSVPCCQHELNKQMKSDNLSILTRYGIVKERTAALMTDAIRGNLLTESGYRTQLLEFVDLSHTPKNLLIRAVRSMIPASAKKQARAEVDAIEKEFGLQPTLDTLLHGKEA